jgi:hypothetical protein
LVNALLKNTDIINATTIDPKKLITDDYKDFSKLFLSNDSLDCLVNEIKKEILDKLEPKESKKETKAENKSSTQSRNEQVDPLLIGKHFRRNLFVLHFF